MAKRKSPPTPPAWVWPHLYGSLTGNTVRVYLYMHAAGIPAHGGRRFEAGSSAIEAALGLCRRQVCRASVELHRLGLVRTLRRGTTLNNAIRVLLEKPIANATPEASTDDTNAATGT